MVDSVTWEVKETGEEEIKTSREADSKVCITKPAGTLGTWSFIPLGNWKC